MVGKLVDKYWKHNFSICGKELIKRFTSVDVERHDPTETVVVDPTTYEKDMVFTKNKLKKIVVEFQHSSLTYDDLGRFALYAYSLSRKYGVFVSLYVICGPEVKNIDDKYILDEFNNFQVNVISMADFDGDETLDNIIGKIEADEVITEEDFEDLLLLPLMSSENSFVTQIEKGIDVVDRIKTLPDKKINIIKDSYFLLSLHFCKTDEELKRLIGKITMHYGGLNNALADWEDEIRREAENSGRIKWIKEGVVKGQIELINRLISEGFSAESLEKFFPDGFDYQNSK